MSDDSPSGGELDALKVYVWGMAAVSLIGAGVVWWLGGKTDETLATVASAKSAMKEVSDGRKEIQAMLGAYTRNKEDEAREQPLTWFQQVWKTLGIPDNSIQLDEWESDVGPDGTYKEEKMGIKFSTRNPIRLELAGQFLHRIEYSSTRLRILTLQLRRAGRDETLGEDSWTGQFEVAYRYPNVKD